MAETDAKVSVLNRLLYDGIPDAGVSAVRLPMVEDGSKLSSQQRSEVNKLLQGDALNRYFTEVAWVSQSSTAAVGGGALQRFRLKVNYDLFRRDLESHGIVRKFGM